MNSNFSETVQGFLNKRPVSHSVECRPKSGVTPASSSSQFSIGVTSTAISGPKLDPPSPRSWLRSRGARLTQCVFQRLASAAVRKLVSCSIDLMGGEMLGRYRIVSKLGEGGMGAVYRARDERLERDVALKLLTPGTMSDENARRRFRKEAMLLSQLNHPNIATVHDFDTQDGVDFLVLELIPGEALAG